MSFHKSCFEQSDKIKKLTLQIKSLNRTLHQLAKSDRAEDILVFEKHYARYGRLVSQLRNQFPTSVEWYNYYDEVLMGDMPESYGGESLK